MPQQKQIRQWSSDRLSGVLNHDAHVSISLMNIWWFTWEEVEKDNAFIVVTMPRWHHEPFAFVGLSFFVSRFIFYFFFFHSMSKLNKSSRRLNDFLLKRLFLTISSRCFRFISSFVPVSVCAWFFELYAFVLLSFVDAERMLARKLFSTSLNKRLCVCMTSALLSAGCRRQKKN